MPRETRYADAAPEDSPIHEPMTPPGDFSTSGFFTSPSTWIALSTYSIPFLNYVFRTDVSEMAMAAGNLVPMVSTGVLVWARSRAKEKVTDANLELAKVRLGMAAPRQRDGEFEERIDELELKVVLLERLIEELDARERDELPPEEPLEEEPPRPRPQHYGHPAGRPTPSGRRRA